MDRNKSVVDSNYVWYAKNDNELTVDLRGVSNIEGVLAIEQWDNSIVDFMKENQIEGLWIRGDKFYTSKYSLQFLKELTDLKYLKIDGKFKKQEYKVVENMSKLEKLSFGDYEAYDINFKNIKNLKTYFSPIKHEDHPIFDVNTIEYFGTNTSLQNFFPFSKLVNIKELYIMAKNLTNLRGVEKLINLYSVEIDYGRNIYDFSDISKVTSLKKLLLYGCKKLNKLDDISKIPNLECLWFDNCGIVESLKPISKLTSLKFIAFGDTIIKDGDIECLFELKILKGAYFKNRKHYNSKYDNFGKYNYMCT